MRATVITDASHCPDTKVGGWAAWIRYDGDRGPTCRSGPLRGKIPNASHAEVRAALNGIWLAQTIGADRILLQTDCQTVLDLITGKLKAPDLVALWAAAFERADMKGLVIEGRHVKGHGPITDARTYINDWCDKFAKQHMKKARRDAGRTR